MDPIRSSAPIFHSPISPLFPNSVLSKKIYDIVIPIIIISITSYLFGKFLRKLTSTDDSSEHSKYVEGINLTDACKKNTLDCAAIGRDDVIQKLIRVFDEGKSCLLVGQNGCGKTTILNAFVEAMSHHKPNLNITLIDLVAVTAGGKWMGDLAARVVALSKKYPISTHLCLFKNFYHSLHTSMSSADSNPIAQGLLSCMETKKIRIFSILTPSELEMMKARYGNLTKCFECITITALSDDQIVAILVKLKPSYERNRNCTLPDEVIRLTVSLCAKYFCYRPRLHESMKVIDEACLNVNSTDTTPSEITEHMIKAVVGKYYGAPITQVTDKEKQGLLNLPLELNQIIIGQPEAVDSISKAIQKSRLDLSDPEKPAACILFIGSTGVGKTELVVQTAQKSGRPHLLVNMGAYSESKHVDQLAVRLMKFIDLHPHAIIHLDEIEKAAPEIILYLVGVLGSATISASNGNEYKYKLDKVIFILTSNIGCDLAGLDTNLDHETLYKRLCETAHKGLRDRFLPEFLNRLDKVIFQPIGKEVLKKLVDLQINKINQIVSKHSISLNLDQEAEEFIMRVGYNIEMGVRELARTMERYILNPITTMILKNDQIIVTAQRTGTSLICSVKEGDPNCLEFHN